jgi:hypothetical protein
MQLGSIMPEMIIRPRVLVADDREENRYVLSRVLAGAGYECVEAGTGFGTLEIARTPPDVIILDVNLPDISAIRKLLQFRFFKFRHRSSPATTASAPLKLGRTAILPIPWIAWFWWQPCARCSGSAMRKLRRAEPPTNGNRRLTLSMRVWP